MKQVELLHRNKAMEDILQEVKEELRETEAKLEEVELLLGSDV